MSKIPRYVRLARTLGAWIRCVEKGNEQWTNAHQETIDDIVETAPSGSGIDNGTTFDTKRSTPEKLRFGMSFHHMNDVGMYDGWTNHEIVVKPSLQFGCVLRITGRDRNDIKDYLHEVYSTWLEEEVEEYENA